MDIATLLSARSRGEVKRYGGWLDGEGRATRPILVAEAKKRGADVPDDWEELDGKRLLRACLARADESQVRTNPIQRDEAFTCAHCGADVPIGGRRPRDHCPRCLHSLLHGDVAQAAAYNVLFLLFLPFLLFWAGRAWLSAVTGHPVAQFRFPSWSGRLLLGILIAFWVLRNLPFWPFDLLAPHRL